MDVVAMIVYTLAFLTLTMIVLCVSSYLGLMVSAAVLVLKDDVPALKAFTVTIYLILGLSIFSALTIVLFIVTEL